MHRLVALLILASCSTYHDRADVHYGRAEELYRVGDFERAAGECDRALQLAPDHGAARELRWEIQWMLSQDLAPMAPHKAPGARCGRAILEIDELLRRGHRAYPDDPERSAREFRRVLEYAKWLPDSPELRARTARARNSLVYVESRGIPPLPERFCECVLERLRPGCRIRTMLDAPRDGLPSVVTLGRIPALVQTFDVAGVSWPEDPDGLIDLERPFWVPDSGSLRELLDRVSSTLFIAWKLNAEHVIEIQWYDDDSDASRFLREATDCLRSGDFEHAEVLCESAIRAAPDWAEARELYREVQAILRRDAHAHTVESSDPTLDSALGLLNHLYLTNAPDGMIQNVRNWLSRFAASRPADSRQQHRLQQLCVQIDERGYRPK